jgi:negative regulator of flagellin synthesis FlgM
MSMPSVELSKLPGVSAPRAVTASDRAQIEARPRAAAPASPGAAPGISLEVSGASEAAGPPVDAERVTQIKQALRDGSYPLVPAKITDAMIAAQVSLSLPERS